MPAGIEAPTHDDDPMKPFLIVAGILVLLMAITVGAFSAMGIGGTVDYSTMTGPELYKKLCQQCHGKRGTGGAGNSYARKRDLWTQESLLEYIADPVKVKATMPHLRNTKKSMQGIPRSVPQAARERLALHVIQLMDNLK